MLYTQRLPKAQPDISWYETGYFFHKGDMSVWKCKTAGSHDCFRLTWQDAIWLFEIIPSGTPVIVEWSLTNKTIANSAS